MLIEEVVDALDYLCNDGEIEILCKSDNKILIYDLQYGKEIPYNLDINEHELIKRIYIGKNVPERYRPDKLKVAEYLLKHMPYDAFWTLDKICFICGDEDDCAALSEMFNEDVDWVNEILFGDYLGKLWFEYNSVLININSIIKSALEIESEDISLGLIGNAHTDTLEQIVVTLVHELRHLMLDTNIVLSEDEFPVELNSEEAIEDFARELVFAHGFDIYKS